MGEVSIREVLNDIHEQFTKVFSLLSLLTEKLEHIEDLYFELEKINAKTPPLPGKMPNCS